jgi:hypothetical protein
MVGLRRAPAATECRPDAMGLAGPIVCPSILIGNCVDDPQPFGKILSALRVYAALHSRASGSRQREFKRAAS